MSLRGARFGQLAIVASATLMIALAARPTRAQEGSAPPAADGGAEAVDPIRNELDLLREEIRRLREAEVVRAISPNVEAELRKELETLRAEVIALRSSTQESSRSEVEAELAQISAELDAVASVEDWTPSFRLYGFSDMGIQRAWGSKLVAGHTSTPELTFLLGHINFYFEAEPVPHFRSLTEVRFTMLPNGTENLLAGSLGEPKNPTDTTVYDVTSPSAGLATTQWGAIILERSHIDWSARDWLNVRVGFFLTPYGIWNVDHGTPTLISTTFPGFQMVQILPMRQMGVEVFGTVRSAKWSYEYHLYVSNGRVPFQLDLTDNKALGGRLVARTSSPTRMAFGLSAYTGRYQDRRKVTRADEPGEFRIDFVDVVSYRESAIGGDVSLDFGPLRIRSEVAARRVVYDEGKRESWYNLGPAADRVEIGSYALVAYRLPWLGMEPFFFLDFLKYPTFVGEAVLMPSVGLNFHLNPSTVLKFQYTYFDYFDLQNGLPPAQDEHLHLFVGRLAIAF